MENRKLIVLTPVKNEAWILPMFLKATSVWADYIIVADQDSTDGSLEIYNQFSKVVVIHNDSKDLDEGYRDNLMLTKARELVGTNSILFRIDADEIFTPNFDSKGWNDLITSEPGSVWSFFLGGVGPKYCGYSESDNTYGAFVDDGREYKRQGLIHNRNMFAPEDGSQSRLLKDMMLLHLQFVDWERMESKHRWYQCFERINYPNKSAIDIYRRYHWMYDKSLFAQAFKPEWIDGYRKLGVDLTDVVYEHDYWWDDQVKSYVQEYGSQYFC
ncbi:MAG: glycosyltransferase family 2 protein, partial [Agathobacter sp.]